MAWYDDATDWAYEEAQTGSFGTGPAIWTNLNSAGEAIPEEHRDDIREAVSEDEDASWEAWLAVQSSTYTADGVDALEEGAEGVGDAVYTIADPSNYLPWWLPWAAGGIALLAVLWVLSPYAKLGAEVAT